MKFLARWRQRKHNSLPLRTLTCLRQGFGDNIVLDRIVAEVGGVLVLFSADGSSGILPGRFVIQIQCVHLSLEIEDLFTKTRHCMPVRVCLHSCVHTCPHAHAHAHTHAHGTRRAHTHIHTHSYRERERGEREREKHSEIFTASENHTQNLGLTQIQERRKNCVEHRR